MADPGWMIERLDTALTREARADAPQHSDESHRFLILLFHRMRAADAPVAPGSYYCDGGITTSDFARVVEFFKARRYEFFTPRGLKSALSRHHRCVMLTFDDGYADNLQALPILEAHQVPAVFFISPGPVVANEIFWWDAVFREESCRGTAVKKIHSDIARLAALDVPCIRDIVLRRYGVRALEPTTEFDRPLSVAELRDCAASPWIEIGNHSYDHSLLVGKSLESARRQLLLAQSTLEEITGLRPISVSYPYGIFTDETIELAKSCGFEIGLTSDKCWNSFPSALSAHNLLSLGRWPLSSRREIHRQLHVLERPFTASRMYYVCRTMLHSVRRSAHHWRLAAFFQRGA